MLQMLVAQTREYAIFRLDRDGCVSSWHAGAKRLSGYTGCHFSVLFPAEDVAEGKPEMHLSVVAATGRLEDEGWRVRRDGSRFWANVVITPWFGSGGILCGFIGGFALDDFGTGFGSFFHLKHLPYGYIKIDGDFVRGMRTNANDRLLVEAIVFVAKGMNKKTIAEFVGDDETTNLLRDLGVDYGQGYHLGKPAPIKRAAAHLPVSATANQSTDTTGLHPLAPAA